MLSAAFQSKQALSYMARSPPSRVGDMLLKGFIAGQLNAMIKSMRRLLMRHFALAKLIARRDSGVR